MHTDIARARHVYGRLIDPGVTGFGAVLEAGAEERADELSLRLSRLFGERPELAGIMIRVAGQDVGVSTPARLWAAAGQAAATAEPGGGDRASLPGVSGEYRVIRFGCASPGCGSTAARSFYDARVHPVCEVAAGHGPMELRR